jgi:hypothetical protein
MEGLRKLKKKGDRTVVKIITQYFVITLRFNENETIRVLGTQRYQSQFNILMNMRCSNLETVFQSFLVKSNFTFTLHHFHFWKELLTNRCASENASHSPCTFTSLTTRRLSAGKQNLYNFSLQIYQLNLKSGWNNWKSNTKWHWK